MFLHAQTPIATRGISGDLWADRILGQGDYGIPNSAFGEDKPNEATSANVFNASSAMVDTARNILYVWDGGNSRILAWNNVTQAATGQGADVVLGQPDFFHGACNHDANAQAYDWRIPLTNHVTLPGPACFCGNGGQSPYESTTEANMAVDKAGNLYVPDFLNNRVLRFDYPVYTGEAASHVWGQKDFNSATPTLSKTGLAFNYGGQPVYGAGVATDGNGNLWVADHDNHRVLRFPVDCNGLPQTVADVVLGQSDFNSATAAADNTDQSHLYYPQSLRVDAAGNVYVTEDGVWGRLSVFYPTGTTVEFCGSGPVTQFTYGVTINAVLDQHLSSAIGIEFDPSITSWPLPAPNPSSPPAQVGFWVTDFNLGYVQLGVHLSMGFPATVTSVSSPQTINLPGQIGSLGVDGNQNLYHGAAAGVLRCKLQSPTYLPIQYMTNQNVGVSNMFNYMGNVGFFTAGDVAVDSSGGAPQIIVADGLRLHFWNMPGSGIPGLENGQPEDGYAATNEPYVYQGLGFGQMANDDVGHLWALQLVPGNHTDVKRYNLPFPIGSPETSAASTLAYNVPLPILGMSQSVTWYGPSGLALDLAGNLWISDQVFNRVMRIRDPLGQNPSACGGGAGPCVDMVLGQPNPGAGPVGTGCNGNGTNLVGGTLGPCSNTTPAAWTLNSPGFLRVDHNGDLFVSDHFFESQGNCRLLRWDAKSLPSTQTVCQFGVSADGVYGTAGSFNTYRVCTADPGATGCPPGADVAAYAWQVDFNPDDSVMVVGTDAQLVGSMGAPPNPLIIQNPRNGIMPPGIQDTPGAGDNPIGYLNDFNPQTSRICFDGQGNLYTSNGNRNRVLIYAAPFPTFTPTPTGTLTPFTTPTPTSTPTNGPTDTETSTRTPGPTSCATAASWPVTQPYGVAWGASSGSTYVYVADNSVSLIDVFSPSGALLTQAGSGAVTQPVGVAVDGMGNLYVTDETKDYYTTGQTQYRIDVFSGSFGAVTQWGTRGSSTSEFEVPVGIGVNSAGTTVYVADQNTEQVEAYYGLGAAPAQAGKLILQFGGPGTGVSFTYPVGVAVDNASGNVYVTDSDTGLVQVFTYQGIPVTSGGVPLQWDVTQNTPLLAANFIAIQGCMVYVTDGFGAVGIFNLNGNTLGSITQWGSTEFYECDGIAAGSDGSWYVADYANDQLFKFGACPAIFCASPTPTATNAPTQSPTMTATPTLSSSPTNTQTPSPTFTPTNSPSLTPSSTTTSSPTVTLSSTPTSSPTEGCHGPAFYPNPALSGNTISLHFSPCDQGREVKVKIFTLVSRKVLDKDFASIPIGTDPTLELKDNWGMPLANGLYYLVTDGPEGRTIGKLLVLR